MVCDVLSWFMMVRGSLSWFVMFCHGSWCFVVVRHGSSWFVMVRHGSWCFVVVRCGSWWFVVVHGGSIVVVSWWFIVVRSGFPWWFFGGSWWFVVVFLQKSPEKGHVTLYLTNHRTKFTMKSHFWWDFLFAPFHLKSIPLKSSAKNKVCSGCQISFSWIVITSD